MTKNNAMRLGSVMLVLALLSTCALCGTFAKYTTKATNATDTARVAKWGVNLSAPSDVTIFDASYAKDGTTEIANTVVSSTSGKVLAPGTKGDVPKATLSGKTEVATKVSYKVDKLDLTGWTISYTNSSSEAKTDEFYFPVKFTVGSDTVDTSSATSAADVKQAIQDALDDKAVEVAAGTELSTGVTQPEIKWSWDFPSTADANTDIKDTALGTAANSTDQTIEIAISTSVTQID